MLALTWLSLAGPVERWRALGFETDPFVVGGIALEIGSYPAWGFGSLVGDGAGLGVPTFTKPPPGDGPAHPNLVDRVDHVVYAVPRLDAAIAAIGEVLGIEPRRRARPRENGPEMAFYRVGPAVLEVVEAGAGPLLWGIAFGSPDLDATVAAIRAAGGEIGEARPAVQGGRIASVPRRYLDVPIAVMEAPRGSQS